MDMKTQYSTFGSIALNEVILELGYNILEEDGQKIELEIQRVINETNDLLEEKFNYPHNCEQVPAETAAVKIAIKDKILEYNDEYELYSNQFIPLNSEANLLDRIYLQGKFDEHFSGGAAVHLNVSSNLSKQTMKDLIRTCLENKCVYSVVVYRTNYCENNHSSIGKVEYCPICGKEVEVCMIVVGFMTKQKFWNRTRREIDFPNRVFYDIEEVL